MSRSRSDDSETFSQNRRLLLLEADDPDDPPVFDCEHEVTLGTFEVGEYMGLTIRNKPGGGYEVWATYTGSLPATYDPDDSTLIWASVVPQ